MGCCWSNPENSSERQPLLQANHPETLVSARQPRPEQNGTEQKSGRFVARRVGVLEIDQHCEDVANMFNRQQEYHEAATQILKTLGYRYRCSPGNRLSECMKKIMDEHDTHRVSLQMKGYDFSLMVVPVDEVPAELQRTQDSVGELCRAAKATVAEGTKLQEMISWLLKGEESLAEQVRAAAPSHQEQQRLGDNLRENVREARRARELSVRYREEAGKLLNEAALLSGATP